MPGSRASKSTRKPAITKSKTPAGRSVSPKKSGLSKLWLSTAIIVAAVVIAGIWWTMASRPASNKAADVTPTFRIGLSLDTYKELRWAHDRDLIAARAKSLGGAVTTLVADSDDKTQVAQIENLIAQKVDVLIIVPHDANAVAPTIAEAHKAGIKVIAYDRLILDSDLDAYVTFDSTLIGKYQAQYVMKAISSSIKTPNVALVGGSDTDNNAVLVHQGVMGVLNPLVTSGKARIVYDQYTPDWSADAAFTSIDNFLTKGGKLDAVIAANDGTAGGVIKALKAHGLDGKVPVSGGDAELPAVQRLVSGTQTVTVYTPFSEEAYKAVDLAYQYVKHQTPTTNGLTNNGQKDVPSFLLDSTPVTKDNIKQTVIKDGFYTSNEVYGAAAQ